MLDVDVVSLPANVSHHFSNLCIYHVLITILFLYTRPPLLVSNDTMVSTKTPKSKLSDLIHKRLSQSL